MLLGSFYGSSGGGFGGGAAAVWVAAGPPNAAWAAMVGAGALGVAGGRHIGTFRAGQPAGGAAPDVARTRRRVAVGNGSGGSIMPGGEPMACFSARCKKSFVS